MLTVDRHMRVRRMSAHAIRCLTLGSAILLLAAAGIDGLFDARADEISPATFDDADLTEAISAGSATGTPRGIVYVWSPHMPYSVHGLQDVLDLGQRLELPVIALLDPDADWQLAARVAEVAGLPGHALRAMRSNRLFDLGVTLHYPTLLVFGAGRLGDAVLPGHASPAVGEAFVRAQLMGR